MAIIMARMALAWRPSHWNDGEIKLKQSERNWTKFSLDKITLFLNNLLFIYINVEGILIVIFWLSILSIIEFI